jgi:transcriptional regulator GlxA family with amidase domain
MSFKTFAIECTLQAATGFCKEFIMRDRTIWVPLLAGILLTSALCIIRLAKSPHVAATVTPSRPLKPPSTGPINVAFVISKGADVMDIAGSWEVFSDTMLTSKGQPWHGGDDMVMPFDTYTVSESLAPLDANGLTVVPNYTFTNAPKPRIIVIPAQGGRSETQRSWLLANAQTADVTMSVCTGASMLAEYGMLDGETATTHHLYERGIQQRYPAVHFIEGMRFVENDRVSTAAGLTSGIDLALHVVERYYGRSVAQATADYLEYHSDLWKSPEMASVVTGPAGR